MLNSALLKAYYIELFRRRRRESMRNKLYSAFVISLFVSVFVQVAVFTIAATAGAATAAFAFPSERKDYGKYNCNRYRYENDYIARC